MSRVWSSAHPKNDPPSPSSNPLWCIFYVFHYHCRSSRVLAWRIPTHFFFFCSLFFLQAMEQPRLSKVIGDLKRSSFLPFCQPKWVDGAFCWLPWTSRSVFTKETILRSVYFIYASQQWEELIIHSGDVTIVYYKPEAFVIAFQLWQAFHLFPTYFFVSSCPWEGCYKMQVALQCKDRLTKPLIHHIKFIRTGSMREQCQKVTTKFVCAATNHPITAKRIKKRFLYILCEKR